MKYSDRAACSYAPFFTFAPELVIRCSTVQTVELKREPGESPGLRPQL